MKKFLKIVLKLFITLLGIAGLVAIIFFVLRKTGALDKIDDVTDLKNTIKSYGIWSRLFFFALQFLQVTFIPLPSALTTLAGTIVFGPLQAFIISVVAIFLGSLLAFFLGKKFGKPLVKWIVGEDFDKLESKLSKGKYMFFLMLLFPLFPDDTLCLLAGTSNMTYRFFINCVLIARPISIFCLCFVGSGSIIPFSGWGIPVWIVMLLSLAVLMIFSIKKQNEIEKWLGRLNTKIKVMQDRRTVKKLAIKTKKDKK